jgi:hypothetical protein
MKTISTLAMSLLGALTASVGYAAAPPAGSSRQAEVATRGAQVMPFNLQATTHIFSKVADGGIQQVVAKSPGDETQVRLVREHLQQITDQFGKGDFSGPERIHGMSMPGLPELRKAKPGDIQITYQDIPSGGQIRYSTSSKALVAALHEWFDAQLSDHGADAMEGHHHEHMKMQHE